MSWAEKAKKGDVVFSSRFGEAGIRAHIVARTTNDSLILKSGERISRKTGQLTDIHPAGTANKVFRPGTPEMEAAYVREYRLDRIHEVLLRVFAEGSDDDIAELHTVSNRFRQRLRDREDEI